MRENFSSLLVKIDDMGLIDKKLMMESIDEEDLIRAKILDKETY